MANADGLTNHDELVSGSYCLAMNVHRRAFSQGEGRRENIDLQSDF